MRISIRIILLFLMSTGMFIEHNFGDYLANTHSQNNANQEESLVEGWYLGKKISAIEFVGLETISKFDMLNVLTEYKNKIFTLEMLQEIQDVLYELEYFEEIIPEAQQSTNGRLILLFVVVEKATIGKIRFTGNEAVGDSAIQGVLTIRKGEIFNDFKASEEINAIKNKYFDQGYPQVNITYEISPIDNDKNEVVLEFIIVEGIKTTISEIDFIGNILFKDNKLKRTISSKKKTIIQKGAFSETLLEEDKILIINEYNKQGYIDAQVIDVLIDRSDDPKNTHGVIVKLTYIIREGEPYTFNGITFEGNSIYTSEELMSLFPLEEGKNIDLTKFQRGYDRVRLKYADQGFIFNSFDYNEIRDTERKTIAFLITIAELGQSHIENIVIAGNVKTKDYVILRTLGIQEGDVFSASALNYARLNLMNLRYFHSVIPDSRPGSAPSLIDLIFKLEEDRTRDIRFGATFGGSSTFPLSLFLSWNQPNLAGRGLVLNVKGTASPSEQSASVVFAEPRLFSSPFSLSSSLSYSHELVDNVPQDIMSPNFEEDEGDINYDPYSGHYVFTNTVVYEGISYKAGDPFPGTPTSAEIEEYNLKKDYKYYGTGLSSVYNNSLMHYDNHKISWTIGTGYVYYSPIGKLGTSVSLGPSINYVYYDKYVHRPADIQVRNNLEYWRWYNTLSWKGYFDSRDLVYIPTQGVYVSQSFALHGGLLFGDIHYIRSTSLIEGHVKLFDWAVLENWSWKMVLAGQTVFTALLPQFYYPEGTSYEKNGPSYVQKLDLNGVYNSRGWPRVRNGEATWNNWLELRMPLYETVVWWDQFLEISTLWNKLDEIESFDISKYQFTFGTGFRFVIQQFPIRIYLGKRFSVDEEYNVVWQKGNFADSSAGTGDGIDLIFTIGSEFF